MPAPFVALPFQRLLSLSRLCLVGRRKLLCRVLLVAGSVMALHPITNAQSGRIIALRGGSGGVTVVSVNPVTGVANDLGGPFSGSLSPITAFDARNGVLYFQLRSSSSPPVNTLSSFNVITGQATPAPPTLPSSYIGLTFDPGGGRIIALRGEGTTPASSTVVSINPATGAVNVLAGPITGGNANFAATFDEQGGVYYYLLAHPSDSGGPTAYSVGFFNTRTGQQGQSPPLPSATTYFGLAFDRDGGRIIALRSEGGTPASSRVVSIDPAANWLMNNLSGPITSDGFSPYTAFDVVSDTYIFQTTTALGSFNIRTGQLRVAPTAALYLGLAFQSSNPLIVIPGVAGSQLNLVGTGANIWLNSSVFAFPATLDYLTLDPNQQQYDVYAPDGQRTAVGMDLYDSLLRKLAQSGYKEYRIDGHPERLTEAGCDYQNQKNEQPDLFVFPYDWRLSNSANAGRLAGYMKCVQMFHPNDKVNLLTHSMGSLLARRYVINNPGTHNVDRHVSIAAPWLGAAKFNATLETGLFLENPGDALIGSHIKRLVEFFPGPDQLLPSRAYFDLGGRPFAQFINVTGAPVVFDEADTWDEMAAFINREHPRGKPALTNDQFHSVSGQDDWRGDNSGVKYFHIIGKQGIDNSISQVVRKVTVHCGLVGATGKVICESPQVEFELKRGTGDGTVPDLSARRIGNGSSLNAPTATLVTFCGNGTPAGDTAVSHVPLPSNALVQEQALLFLQGLSKKISPCDSSPSAPTEDGLALVAETQSPAYYIDLYGAAVSAVSVTDAAGVSTTPTADFPAGRDVPGVTVNVLGPKAASLALNKEAIYTITLVAGDAPLVVRISEGTGAGFSRTVRYQDLVLPLGLTAMLKTGPDGIEGMKYDSNGDGTFETSVPPTASVTGAAAQDVEGPAVSVTGTAEGANVRVQIAATDGGSGVKSLFYSQDGTTYQPYISPFTVDPNQGPIVYAFADDNLANRSGLAIYYPTLTANPLGNAQFFVRQHYLDFLNREADASGLQFWVGNIAECGSNAQCVEVKRINVSAAFFLSIEFRETGYLAYRAHKAAFGNLQGKPVPITREEMLSDMQVLGSGVVVGAPGWQEKVEQNKQTYFDQVVASEGFAALYPQSLTPAQFVDALNSNAAGALSTAERNQLVADLTNGIRTRAQVLRAVAEDADLDTAEKNKAFVLMQFFGYLRRDPDSAPDTDFAGYSFWLGKLNQFHGDFIQAEMVKAFIDSIEYKQRFGQ